MRGGGWNGERCRRGGVKSVSMVGSVTGLVRSEKVSERLWLKLQIFVVLEVLLGGDVFTVGSWERRRRSPVTAYCTGYAK